MNCKILQRSVIKNEFEYTETSLHDTLSLQINGTTSIPTEYNGKDKSKVRATINIELGNHDSKINFKITYSIIFSVTLEDSVEIDREEVDNCVSNTAINEAIITSNQILEIYGFRQLAIPSLENLELKEDD